MKVIVRKPKNDRDVWEAFEESSWLKWMGRNGEPLSSPGGGYSRPVEVPDEYAGMLEADDFDVTETVKTKRDPYSDEETEYVEISAVFVEPRCKERIKNVRTDYEPYQ